MSPRLPAVLAALSLLASAAPAYAVPPAADTAAPAVSVETLLGQMTDLEWLTRLPKPAFTAGQAASFDRRSVPGPDNPKPDPWANGDAGQFLRTETRPDGRIEKVLADLKGPGAVVRLWSANPAGTLRLYFDGETTPRVEAAMEYFLRGSVKMPRLDHDDPKSIIAVTQWEEAQRGKVPTALGSDFAYVAARGYNAYFPFPYARSLKITVSDDTPGETDGLYYHVGYRTYEAGTRVRTFVHEDFRKALTGYGGRRPPFWQDESSGGNVSDPSVSRFSATLRPGATLRRRVDAPEPGIGARITRLQISVEGRSGDADIRDLRDFELTILADGETTVHAPLGDFFTAASGTRGGAGPIYFSGSSFVCLLPMPFRKSLEVAIRNRTTRPQRFTLLLQATPRPWDDRSLYFRAQWTADDAPTRPFADMTYLDARGAGMLVGVSQQVVNPSPGWWGEGDEKIYVDGERFPSTFGTGTEDFFGYAWCSTETFARPYHAQTRSDGPANFGESDVSRFFILDPIPFRRALRFDMERWHWDPKATLYVARTVYWYSRPGGSGPAKIDAKLLRTPVPEKPKPVAGAIEGESLRATHTGGDLSVQDGFWEVSGFTQRWWRSPKPGDRLTLTVPVPAAGRYRVVANLCHAVDYGRHTLTFAGQPVNGGQPLDFYAPTLGWKRVTLGEFTLPAGDASLDVVCAGADPRARPGAMFGLDYLLLERINTGP